MAKTPASPLLFGIIATIAILVIAAILIGPPSGIGTSDSDTAGQGFRGLGTRPAPTPQDCSSSCTPGAYTCDQVWVYAYSWEEGAVTCKQAGLSGGDCPTTGHVKATGMRAIKQCQPGSAAAGITFRSNCPTYQTKATCPLSSTCSANPKECQDAEGNILAYSALQRGLRSPQEFLEDAGEALPSCTDATYGNTVCVDAKDYYGATVANAVVKRCLGKVISKDAIDEGTRTGDAWSAVTCPATGAGFSSCSDADPKHCGAAYSNGQTFAYTRSDVTGLTRARARYAYWTSAGNTGSDWAGISAQEQANQNKQQCLLGGKYCFTYDGWILVYGQRINDNAWTDATPTPPTCQTISGAFCLPSAYASYDTPAIDVLDDQSCAVTNQKCVKCQPGYHRPSSTSVTCVKDPVEDPSAIPPCGYTATGVDPAEFCAAHAPANSAPGTGHCSQAFGALQCYTCAAGYHAQNKQCVQG